MTYELDVISTEYIEPESIVQSGDLSREVQRPVENRHIHKGRLHLRLANVGYQADPKLARTGMHFHSISSIHLHVHTCRSHFLELNILSNSKPA